MTAPDQKLRGCPIGCQEPGSALGQLEKTVPFPLSHQSYTLTRCGCGKLLYMSPAPTDADLHALYVENIQFAGEYDDAQRVDQILEYIGGCFDRMARERAWPEGRTSVLEVGAGMAWMARAAKARSATNRTVAQDISPEAVEHCPWVDDYVRGSLDDAAIDGKGPYHLISMTHVIEHLVDPVGVLRRCRDLLHENGLIFVTAPHRPRHWRDGEGGLSAWTRYSYNHVPAHIQYFSEGSMSRLAKAVDCRLAHWTHQHEEGEAFEAWLAREDARPPRRGILGWFRR